MTHMEAIWLNHLSQPRYRRMLIDWGWEFIFCTELSHLAHSPYIRHRPQVIVNGMYYAVHQAGGYHWGVDHTYYAFTTCRGRRKIIAYFPYTPFEVRPVKTTGSQL